MKKIIFGLFAHPDDEAFGVAGTLLKEKQAGSEIHLVVITSGEAGVNLDGHSDLGPVRLEEWYKAGDIIGVASQHFLGYTDGKLTNESMLEIADKFENFVKEILSNYSEDLTVEFITLDTNGVTGHIDHIVASRATCLAFYRLKPHESRLDRIRLRCLSIEEKKHLDCAWVYCEEGCSKDSIDETIDARDIQDQIISVMQAHHTQRNDCRLHLEARGDSLGIEYFRLKS